MNKNNVVNCFHEFFASSLNKEIKIEFCKNCGIMAIDSKPLKKPNEYNTKCELDQLLTYFQIKENFAKKIFQEKDEINTDYLNKRSKILNYLKRLCDGCGYSEETFNVALSYIDRILINSKNIKYDLVVIGSLLLSIKFVEMDPTLPNYSVFLNPNKEYYSKEEISNAEKLCLKILNHNLSIYSSLDILKYFLINGLVHSDDSKMISSFYFQARNIMNYFNQDVRSVDFSNMEVALSSILLASEITAKNLDKKVKQTLNKIYGIKVENFVSAYFVIKNIYPAANELFKNEKNSRLIDDLKNKKYRNNIYKDQQSQNIYNSTSFMNTLIKSNATNQISSLPTSNLIQYNKGINAIQNFPMQSFNNSQQQHIEEDKLIHSERNLAHKSNFSIYNKSSKFVPQKQLKDLSSVDLSGSTDYNSIKVSQRYSFEQFQSNNFQHSVGGFQKNFKSKANLYTNNTFKYSKFFMDISPRDFPNDFTNEKQTLK